MSPPPKVFGYSQTKGTRSTRSRNPTPVIRTKDSTNYQSADTEEKNPIKPLYFPKERDYSDCESRAGSDKTFVDVTNYRVEDYPPSPMAHKRAGQGGSSGGRNEYAPRPERTSMNDSNRPGSGHPRSHQTRGSDDINEGYNLDGMAEATPHVESPYIRENPSFPEMPIYEHILLLRQHGASVKYSQKSRVDCLRDYVPREGPMLQRASGPISQNEIMNPSKNEINAINSALASVMNTGGEVEFEALPPGKPTAHLSCGACRKVFQEPHERDDHLGGGRIRCPVTPCPINMPCKGTMAEHMALMHPNDHRNRDNDHFSYADRSSYGSSPEKHIPHNYSRS